MASRFDVHTAESLLSLNRQAPGSIDPTTLGTAIIAPRPNMATMANRVFVLLGSNINKERNLPAAARMLSELCHVVAVSTVYETCPVGLADQPTFFNAAVLVETHLDANGFKRDVLALIEEKLKRVRLANRNAPRTIDADITLFNEEVFELDASHRIPDPELLRFAHVAVPVAELAPDLPHPETGERLADIALRLERQAEETEGTCLLKRPDVVLASQS